MEICFILGTCSHWVDCCPRTANSVNRAGYRLAILSLRKYEQIHESRRFFHPQNNWWNDFPPRSPPLQHWSICANLPGDYWLRRLRIANEEHTIQKHTVACDTMNIHMQRQTTGMPYLLKDKQLSLQQNTRPRMGKKTQAGVQHLLYQLFIITLAPLSPTSQIPHPVR